jgi:hypothetical protein
VAQHAARKRRLPGQRQRDELATEHVRLQSRSFTR